MPFVERDGLRLYDERGGAGATELLFVHGWCCDHGFWETPILVIRPAASSTGEPARLRRLKPDIELGAPSAPGTSTTSRCPSR